MKNAEYYEQQRTYGNTNFNLLVPVLEEYLDEKIQPTTERYDRMDAKSETFDIEVKSRRPNYCWSDPLIMREGWLIPKCKIDHAQKTNRATLFFYWWRKDNSLWVWQYNPEDMVGLVPFVPSAHRDQQEHYNIPFKCWEKIADVQV